MKYKVYNLLDSRDIEKNKNIKVVQDNFEIISGLDLTPAELINKKFDAIELAGDQYENFKSFIAAVDWKTSHIDTVDCLVLLKSGKYKPCHLLADSVLHVLKKIPERVNSQRPVIVIGNIYFLYSVVTKLALSGFVEIIVSLTDAEDEMLKVFEKKIKSFVFNLHIKTVSINHLTTTEQAGYLLISNFRKEDNKDAYELLTYFNFLAEGAVFIDCNSITDSYLVDDARKAEIFVIDELAILDAKYDYLLEIIKNSP
jgi:hypothetical protein